MGGFDSLKLSLGRVRAYSGTVGAYGAHWGLCGRSGWTGLLQRGLLRLMIEILHGVIYKKYQNSRNYANMVYTCMMKCRIYGQQKFLQCKQCGL